MREWQLHAAPTQVRSVGAADALNTAFALGYAALSRDASFARLCVVRSMCGRLASRACKIVPATIDAELTAWGCRSVTR